MLRLKLNKVLAEKEISMYKLHVMTGIRANTVSDLVNNKAKQWSPEALTKIYEALGLTSISQLIEFTEEDDLS
ncbi:helix-turn-helix domain-containing protein [Paenibacillus qinlingensis]|uniref:helix-turn-helix domain-containing protein n=1 Tax=Paenibacillus qinlingensis TaxID=1837343 RepID=UPI001565CF61|nr:helix-turn-helix transcriptional regulator [Paenibacillus qinlingensis]NQX57535.1 helix-turn-helix transcriptional regulator [Paenibacillus qinlingensis]